MSREAEEILFFNNLANDWWDPKGPQAMLHQINPLRLRWISQHLSVKGLKVLDIGCGAGLLTEGLAKMGAKATGLDLAPDLIEIAAQHSEAEGLKIQYIKSSVDTFSKKHPEAFDALFCLEMLEHVEDYSAIIKAIADLLKPGGTLFLSTIDRSPKAFLELIVAAEYVLKIIPRGTHHYTQFIRPDELTASLREHGLCPMYLSGLSYNPLSKSFSISPKPQANYWMVAKKEA